MDIREKLDRLAELREELDAVSAPMRAEIDRLKEKIEISTFQMAEELVGLQQEIKAEVLLLRQTIRGESLQAIYSKGATRWVPAMLRDYAVNHPDVLECRNTGDPQVRIAEVKNRPFAWEQITEEV